MKLLIDANAKNAVKLALPIFLLLRKLSVSYLIHKYNCFLYDRVKSSTRLFYWWLKAKRSFDRFWTVHCSYCSLIGFIMWFCYIFTSCWEVLSLGVVVFCVSFRLSNNIHASGFLSRFWMCFDIFLTDSVEFDIDLVLASVIYL